MRICLALLLILATPPRAPAYSILTHEQIVDLVWASDLEPLILQRYPGLSADQLHDAHAYAYGGAIMDDLGYYPFGDRLFSNLAHYVRTGDLVMAMLNRSQSADEFGFALGAFAHYAADCFGHPAVNKSVAIEFPNLGRRFGSVVTYADNHSAHLRIELSFDIEQIAKYRYPTRSYSDFIGFKISTPLLERVYPEVYGLQLSEVLPNQDLAIGSFRYAVGTVLPKLNSAALKFHEKEFEQQDPGFDRRQFLYQLARKEYEKQWGREYRRPNVERRLLADLIVHLPKVGPLRALAYREPTPRTQALYLQSIDTTVARYRDYLDDERNGVLHLPNRNLDTGEPERRGEYSLTDQTYFQLLQQLAKSDFATVSSDLRNHILTFYAEPTGSVDPEQSPQYKAELNSWLERLNALAPAPPAAASAR